MITYHEWVGGLKARTDIGGRRVRTQFVQYDAKRLTAIRGSATCGAKYRRWNGRLSPQLDAPRRSIRVSVSALNS